MYTIKKSFQISASHSLDLDYESPCKNLHGHNWNFTIFCKSKKLNKNGMIIDFKELKNIVHKVMDHKNLNEIFDFNTTAENIAKWIVDKIPTCYKAIVRESENNEAIYEI